MYTVVRSFYQGDTLHTEGEVFTSEDKAVIEKCLADGNIAVADSSKPAEGATATEAPLAPEPVVSDSPAEPEQPAQVQEPVQPQEPQAPAQPTPEQIDQDLSIA